MNNNFNFYNKELKPFARKLRNNSTKGEIRLWFELLRNKQMWGYSFLRQRPIMNYIVDFMCKELKLIIEVDGYSHEFKYEEDVKRDEILMNEGYTTLKFSEQAVMKDINNVRRAIEIWINENKK